MSLLLTPRRLTSSRVAPKAVRYACHAAKGNDSSRHRRSLACARRRIRGDRPRKSSGWRVSQMGLRDTAPNSKRCKSVVAHRRPAPRSKQRSSSSTRFQIPMYSMAASVTRGGSKYLPSSSSARSPPPPPNLAWRQAAARLPRLATVGERQPGAGPQPAAAQTLHFWPLVVLSRVSVRGES